MMAKGFIRLSMLVLIMHLETQCRAENRWISRPSQTISVKEGSNVTLAWRYILSNNITPRQVTFGVWKPPGYIKTKLLLVTGSGSTMVNNLVKGRLLFEGTLSNPGTATIKILHVSIQDNKTYGFEIDTGLSRSSFKHSFSLLVYTYPARPRIVIQEVVTHSYLRLLWQQPIAHLYPITKYTVWIRKNQSRWRTSNTTLKESIVQLWGEGRYEFGVTAWNRWGQSPLEVNNTVTITRPSPATLIFTGRTEKKTDPRHTTYRTSTHLPTTTIANQDEKRGSKGFFEKFMTHILILIGVTILVTCGICLCVAVLRCRRKNTKGKIKHRKKRKTKRKKLANDIVVISHEMYKEPSTFTLDRDTNEVAEELAPFTKFEVTCTLHNTDVPSMKTFGQRNNSVTSSNTNQDPTDNDIEGGVHIYQDIDQPQGPALPPRNSVLRDYCGTEETTDCYCSPYR
ncbi:uncharacterized protein LOC116309100 [Actinia tenebrosa]|uniref:Uncharacterized protein LOC116309100 n=1 Tax=Actinia tenebrosa TaxID=6105 RepID=A0A6P8J6T9_ACTTE|nr:uncharacterized protein LOC116309100 [Actinia tenebrosa]